MATLARAFFPRFLDGSSREADRWLGWRWWIMTSGGIQRIGILGAGAWGTALAVTAQRAGREVTLWVRRSVQAATLFARRENLLHLPGVMLDPAIRITNVMEAALDADAILVALPAQHLREHLAGLAGRGAPAVLCAKGIEKTSLKAA